LRGAEPGGEDARPGASPWDRHFGSHRLRRDGAEGLPLLLLGLISEARRTARREGQHREQEPDSGDDCEGGHGCVSARLAGFMTCGMWLVGDRVLGGWGYEDWNP